MYFHVKKKDSTYSQCQNLSAELHGGHHPCGKGLHYFGFAESKDKIEICFQGTKLEQFLECVLADFELLYVELEDPIERERFKKKDILDFWLNKKSAWRKKNE
jgi:hypothetical protein